jgi:hypothetical protein
MQVSINQKNIVKETTSCIIKIMPCKTWCFLTKQAKFRGKELKSDKAPPYL